MNKKILALIVAALSCIGTQSAHGWWGHSPYYDDYYCDYSPYYGGYDYHRYHINTAYKKGFKDGLDQERMDDRGPIYDNDNSRGDVTSTGRSAN